MPRLPALSRLTLALCAGLLAMPMTAVADVSADPTARPPGPARAERPDPPPGHANRPDRGNRGSVTPPGRGGHPPPGHGGPMPNNRADHDRPARPAMPSHGPRGPRHACGADGAQPVGPVGTAGRSHMAMLRLGEPGAAPSARLAYGWIGPTLSFVMTADNLAADSNYTLAAMDAGAAVCLASGTSNPGGALLLADAVELDSHLPAALDPFAARDDDSEDATVALLPADAVDCDGGTVVDPDAALIAADGLRFIDTDLLDCPE
jgi:hypothetical protein